MSLAWGFHLQRRVLQRRKTDSVGSAEQARQDTAFYRQAARELGEHALPSAIARHAEKLKRSKPPEQQKQDNDD